MLSESVAELLVLVPPIVWAFWMLYETLVLIRPVENRRRKE